MKLNAKKLGVITASLVSLSAVNAFAYEAGDKIVRGGLTFVSPNDESSLNGTDVVTVDDGLSLGFSGTYMVNNQVGVELLLALPFKHDVNGTGPLAGVAVGEVQHLPPTVSVQYYPELGLGKFQPYVGVGLNYTTFFSEELTPAAKAALNATSLELDDSLSYAVQVGADIELAQNCYVNVGYWYINIETDATVKAAAGDINIGVDINPHVFMVGGAYKF